MEKKPSKITPDSKADWKRDDVGTWVAGTGNGAPWAARKTVIMQKRESDYGALF